MGWQQVELQESRGKGVNDSALMGAQWEVVKIVARQRGGAVDNLLARRSMRGSRGFLY